MMKTLSSMRGRLVLFFLAAVLLPFGLGTTVSELLIDRQVSALAALAGRDSVEPMLGRLDDAGAAAQKALRQMAERPEVTEAFAASESVRLSEGVRIMNAVQRLDFVHAVDRNGMVLASTEPLAGTAWTARAALRAALDGQGRTSFEELPTASSGGAGGTPPGGPALGLVQLVSVPVRRAHEVVGVLFGGTRLSGNTPLCARLSEGTSAGCLIAHRGVWAAGGGQADAVAMVGAPLGQAQRASLDGRRSWFGPSPSGDRDTMTAVLPLASVSGEVLGALGARVDVSELGAVRGSAWRAFVLALIVGASLCLVLARLAARRTLAPLARLARAAAEMEKGKLDVAIAPEGDDEVEQLGRALQRTAIALRESMSTLETRVQERTRELEDRSREIEEARDREHALNRELARQNEELVAQGRELERQRRELEERSRRGEESDRLKNAFIANMSHEIRTPLNSVLALSQLLKDGMAGDVTLEQRRYVEVIERNGQNLLRLINDILDLSRIEAGYMEMDLQAANIGALIRTAAGVLAPLADTKGLDLVVKLPEEELPPVRCDPDRVRQVLTNLIGNAVKFTPQGHVLLSAEARSGAVAVHVTDTGIGIPEAARARIFEEFFQVDQTLARRSGGTGLGLAIASRLVRLMGGELTLESVVGSGSRFTFTLPRHDGAPVGLPAAEEGAGHALAGDALVAVADDAQRVRLTGLLEGAGLNVAVASSGREALARLRTARFDAVILELALPWPAREGTAEAGARGHGGGEGERGEGALEVLAEARRSERLSATPMLVLTTAEVGPAERERLGPPVVAVIPRNEAFSATLLAALGHALQARAAGAARSGPVAPPPGGATILVVEDNDDNLFTLRQILAPLGVEVTAVSNGRASIEYCRTQLPDLILMDVQMPGMSGLQATGAIRALPGGMTVPIVALTAQAMKGDRERILAAGCDEYLSKPISPKVLAAMVRRLLARREDPPPAPPSTPRAPATGGSERRN